MGFKTTCDMGGLHAHAVGLTANGSKLLQDVDLHLQSGQIGAILGPNGAGKSTLLSVLAGLQLPHSGQVTVDGHKLSRANLPELARRRSVLPQDSQMAFDFSAREVVELGRYPHRLHPSQNETSIVQAAMALTNTLHLASRSMVWLSGGERLRVQLARVLAQIWEAPLDGGSRWLLLDEPTSSLDLQHQHAVLGTVRDWAHQHGVGVLMVLHDLNLALRYTDRVWVLEQGRLRTEGSPALVINEALLQDVWSVRGTSVRDRDGCPQQLMSPLSKPSPQV